MEQIVLEKCRLTFTAENYNIPQLVKVQAVEDYKNDGQQPAQIEMYVDSTEAAVDGSDPFSFGDEPASSTDVSSFSPDN